MAGLDGQDRASRSQVGRAHNLCRSTQIRANTDALKDGGGRDKGLGISDAKIVGAGSDGGCPCLCKSSGQEADVSRLVRGNFLEVAIECCVEAGICEVALGEVGQTFSIEGVFEVLQGEGIVEYIGVGNLCGGGLTDLLQERATVKASEALST